MNIICPHCKTKYTNIDKKHIGKYIECPCGNEFEIVKPQSKLIAVLSELKLLLYILSSVFGVFILLVIMFSVHSKSKIITTQTSIEEKSYTITTNTKSVSTTTTTTKPPVKPKIKKEIDFHGVSFGNSKAEVLKNWTGATLFNFDDRKLRIMDKPSVKESVLYATDKILGMNAEMSLWFNEKDEFECLRIMARAPFDSDGETFFNLFENITSFVEEYNKIPESVKEVARKRRWITQTGSFMSKKKRAIKNNDYYTLSSLNEIESNRPVALQWGFVKFEKRYEMKQQKIEIDMFQSDTLTPFNHPVTIRIIQRAK